jgi:transglutaminase-like putative cysteine protease
MRYQTSLIRRGTNVWELRHENGTTEDIVQTVLYGDKKSAWYTAKFAHTLKGRTVLLTVKNIWSFLKSEVPYVLDPSGVQYIKSPGKLLDDRAGDCKSFSVFAGSILQNLGIPFRYRFTSYKPDDPTPTHVYIVVEGPEGDIVLDAVWKGPFATEKKYDHKSDRYGVIKRKTANMPTAMVAGIGGIGSWLFKKTG